MTMHLSLRFDWNEVDSHRITEILGLNAVIMDDGSSRWDAVAICLGSTAVVLTVEPDTDQVIVAREISPSGGGWEPIPSFEFAITKTLGWSWVGINSQGYKDSFTIALGGISGDGLQPRCTFLAEASWLSCFDLIPRRV